MNKIMLSVAAIALSVSALPATVLAQTTPTPDFAVVDSDKSGEVSYGELQIVLPNASEEQFKSADADGSGGLNAQEFTTLAAAGTGTLTQQPPSNTKPDANNNTPNDASGGGASK